MSVPTPEACRAASRLGRTVNSALDDVELSPAGYRVLGYLATGESAATVLAAKLAVSRPSVTAAVDSLEKQGFVTRLPDSSDGRRMKIAMTPRGRQALEAADALVADRLGLVVESLSASQARAVFDSLQLLHDALNTYRARRYEAGTKAGPV